MTKRNKLTIFFCLLLVIILIMVPLVFVKTASFGGSDDQGAEAVSRVLDEEYEPWFVPVLEQYLGGEIPGELESLIFCVQTGIGVGILFFFIGVFYERYRLTSTVKGRETYKKYLKSYEEADES